ncbi:MAG: ScyD/ScyE family protein [Candidatus Limnocylindrales bacterium]
MSRILSLAAATLLVAAPAAAQSPAASGGAPPQLPPLPDGWTQVTAGLDSPRGLAVAADGTIYVAESGEGGTEACIQHPELGNLCFGPTAGISQVKDGIPTRVVDGLLSAITDGGETFGPSAVAVGSDGTVFYLVGGPAAGAADTRALIEGGEGIGQLYALAADGTSTSVADFVAFESESNPDAALPGNELPDSNINGLAIAPDGTILVADAGGNDLLGVASDGTISVAAVFPVVFQPLPPDPTASADPNASPAMIPMDPVPTSVAIGADGAAYVGQLTGFPFPNGGASVFQVVSGQEPVPYATGFTNVMGVAFDADGALYVLEISHDGLLATPPGQLPMGGLWKVPAGGGTPELIATGLPMPGGVAVGGDGTVYVTTCAVCPNGGGIASYTPAG